MVEDNISQLCRSEQLLARLPAVASDRRIEPSPSFSERVIRSFPGHSVALLSLRLTDKPRTQVRPQICEHQGRRACVDFRVLLQDLTDEDVLDDNDDSARFLVEALVDSNTLELLMQNLHCLSNSDPDENVAVYSTLVTIENLIDVKPAVAKMVCKRMKLLKWLLGKVKMREFDSNKQYASEILVILLQSSTVIQKNLGQMNGVDVVLQAVAMYKSKDPKSLDEEEMVENLFECLCCLLMPLENKERFVKAEGVKLMIIIMKQKKLTYDYAIGNTYSVEGEPVNITEPVAEAIGAAFAARCPFLDAMKMFDENV